MCVCLYVRMLVVCVYVCVLMYTGMCMSVFVCVCMCVCVCTYVLCICFDCVCHTAYHTSSHSRVLLFQNTLQFFLTIFPFSFFFLAFCFSFLLLSRHFHFHSYSLTRTCAHLETYLRRFVCSLTLHGVVANFQHPQRATCVLIVQTLLG